MRARERHAALALAVLALACSDDDKKSREPVDAGNPVDQGDADVTYMGPTRGGQIPVGPELEAGPGDNGPFEVSDECCDRTLSIDEADGDTSVRVMGNLPPLDGDGIAAEHGTDVFSAAACMPVGEAVRYRFEVELTVDGGTATVYRTDPTQPTVEDENGDLWNVSVIASCDADAGS